MNGKTRKQVEKTYRTMSTESLDKRISEMVAQVKDELAAKNLWGAALVDDCAEIAKMVRSERN